MSNNQLGVAHTCISMELIQNVFQSLTKAQEIQHNTKMISEKDFFLPYSIATSRDYKASIYFECIHMLIKCGIIPNGSFIFK